MATCAACQADNADGAKFCSECGTAMARACPGCGAVAGGRFCSECGTPLDATQAPPAAVADSPAAPAAPGRLAERRITSVLFGDLVGFTTLSETLDPDDVRELLSRYFTTSRTIVERYGGTVEKFIGDAVMAVWGVPVSHEDDAERAVRAGLDLVDAVALLGEEVRAPGLAMRVGVVTGEVAVTIGAAGEGMVAGDAVNTASRVQSAAKPGNVWVDEQTRELTVAAVMYDDEGAHELKGKAEPIKLYSARQVVAAVGGARRVDGLEAPFCGRDRELRMVKELFHAALEDGRPRHVAVFGAAGVGKSRLGWEFDKYFDGINDVVMGHRGRCLSYGDGVAFWALAEMVRGRLSVLEGDANDVVAERLREGIDRYIDDPADRAWLLPRVATLIGVVDLVAPGATFARDDLFSAWRTFFERVARAEGSAGAVLRVDDAQWADPGLLEFIEHLIDNAQAPIFVLTFARSELTERAPGFGTGRRATAIHLEPLPPAAMADVVDGLVGGLPESLRDVLVTRAEGIPLFAVETVRSLIDRDAVIPKDGRYVLAPDAAGKVDLADLALPTSLHTLIASRLDGLPADERRVVQDAAVMGLSFSHAGLAALLAAVGESADLDAALNALVRKEIIAVESDPRSPERGQYRFVQALVRTVAYDSLARRDRKARHIAVAEFLAGEPDAETFPAVLASHYLDAHAAAGADVDADELAARAVVLLQRAAERARGLGAPEEARRHLESALGLVSDPATVAGLTEATARAALATGAALDAVALADSARQTYTDAGLDLEASVVLAFWGEALIAAGSGQAVIEPLSAAYERLIDNPSAAKTCAQLALSVARGYYLSVGDSKAAIPWFDRAVILGEALEDLQLLSSTLASYSGALVLVGRSRMGLGLLRVSLDLAREIGDPLTQLRPLNNLVSFLATRDPRAARTYAEEGIAIAQRVGDKEFGIFLIGSAAHVYWNIGDWDAVLEVATEVDFERDHSPMHAILSDYVVAVHEARGLPLEVPTLDNVPTGMRADVMLDVAQGLLDAAVVRSQGRLAEVAELTLRCLLNFSQSSGVDDDFPLFWVTALTDQLAADSVETARQVLEVVSGAPIGHVPGLLRALHPWGRARVEAAAGNDDAVEHDFVQAAQALRDFGAPFYLARTLMDHAEWLEHAHRAAEALPMLEEARELFRSLGATPWLLRAGGTDQPVETLIPAAPAGT